MRTSTASIVAADGGTFGAYLAEPDRPRAPGLVLIQYICGVNRVMQELAQRFAAKGYVVAVPDLYWRQQPGVALLDDPAHPDAAEQQRALQLNEGFVDDTGVRDLKATLDFLRAHPSCNGRVGALGYCLGGRLAYLMATRTDVDCAVSYYGVNLQNYLDEASSISRPLLMHMAGNDHLVPPATRRTITDRLDPVSGVDIMVHPGVDHAFALLGGQNYSAHAARNADDASDAFLYRHLVTDEV